MLGTFDPASIVDTAKLTQLRLSLQEKLDTLKCLDEEILELMEENNFEDEIKQADSFKEGIYSAMAKIDKLCITTPPATISVPPPSDVARSAEARGHRVKLPKLTLRAFNGDITTWTTF